MSTPGAIATAALIRDGRVLMVHRNPKRPWYPYCWDLVGGHIEPGETPEQAAIRGCGDKLGVSVCDPRPLPMTFAVDSSGPRAVIARVGCFDCG